MEAGMLGREYADREVICRQGEPGDCMFVIMSGEAVVCFEDGHDEVVLRRLQAGDIFGEMAVFERQPRSATVRAVGNVRALTLDKRAFLRQVHEDPSMAYRILQLLSNHVRTLTQEVSRLKRQIEAMERQR